MQRTAFIVLLVACAAGIAVHSACAEPVDAPRKIMAGEVSKKHKQPTSCGDHKEKHDCLDIGAQEGDCAWCGGDYMPDSCVSTFAAKYIPEMVAKCKLPKKHKKDEVTATKPADSNKKDKKPTSCGDNKKKHDCLDIGAQESDCAWCAGAYMEGSCVSTTAAKFIPEMVAHCKLPKKHEVDNDAGNDDVHMVEKKKGKKGGGDWPSGGGDWPSGGGDWPSGGGDWPSGGGDWPSGGGDSGGGQGQGCMSLKKKHKCLRGTDMNACAWCKNSYLGSKCLDEMTVKYLPKSVADCKIGKKKKRGTVEVS